MHHDRSARYVERSARSNVKMSANIAKNSACHIKLVERQARAIEKIRSWKGRSAREKLVARKSPLGSRVNEYGPRAREISPHIVNKRPARTKRSSNDRQRSVGDRKRSVEKSQLGHHHYYHHIMLSLFSVL